MSPYENTSVAVERSQGDIRKLLASHGAQRFAFGEDLDDGGVRWAMLTFTQHGYVVRIRAPLKPIPHGDAERKARRARHKTLGDIEFEMNEQEAKRIWRVLHWNLKARLEAVAENVETFTEAFLAHIVNPATDRTIYEQLADTGEVSLAEPLLQIGPGEDVVDAEVVE